jgi:hypothetical protein
VHRGGAVFSTRFHCKMLSYVPNAMSSATAHMTSVWSAEADHYLIFPESLAEDFLGGARA